MPDLLITGVKENIARFENVIMKQVYNEAGANSTTTAQVIDEDTGNVICECEAGGGGGGESDFSTADVTINTLVGLKTQGVIGIYEYEGEEYFETGIAEGTTNYKAVLYKGEQTVYVESALGLSITGMEKTGDIEITEEEGTYAIKIKGPGTVTISTTATDNN